jgi:hypothetical protein
MKSTYFWALLLGAPVFGVGANAQQASERTVGSSTTVAAGVKTAAPSSMSSATVDSTRKSDAQALRFQTSWGSADIIRGPDGPVLGTVGWFRGFDVEKLVESSPRAVTEARVFQTNNFRGSVVSAVGATTMAIGILVAGNNSNNASTPILIIAGGGLVGWGLQHINIGYAALSKSLWWYNRDQAH